MQADDERPADGASADLQSFLEGIPEAARRTPAEVVAADEIQQMDDEDFDDALWSAILGYGVTKETLQEVTPGVRAYYSTRLFEWEVAFGGFVEAVSVVADCFDAVIDGYRVLGDEWSLDFLRRVGDVRQDEVALGRFDEEIMDGPTEGAPWGDSLRMRYVRDHRDEFRLGAHPSV